MTTPRLDASATFLHVDDKAVEQFVAESLDGYSGVDGARICSFFLREKESHWVLRTWPAGAPPLASAETDGVRVTLRTSALDVLARHLVGLGGIVRDVEPASLRRAVQNLAREALVASGATLNIEPVGTIRSAR
jgi:hypothetical protein